MTNSRDNESYHAVQARHVRQCWRETKVVAACWFAALIYCTTVFQWLGYLPADQRPTEPPMVWGIPAWVFWGLLVPWIVLILVTWLFAILVLKDDEPFLPPPDDGSDDAAARN